MDESLEQELADSYPSFFEYYDTDIDNNTPAPNISLFGFECNDGWYEIIDALCRTLSQNNISLKVVQVKEKFGGLRFYYENVDIESETQASILYGAVKMAEEMSIRTCEICGDSGELRDETGWYQTRCKNCFEHN